jgi:hypothetical protein
MGTIEELKQENEILRDLLQQGLPQGCIAETTYQPILDENEKLKEKNDELKLEIEATKKVNCFLALQWKEMRTTINLAKIDPNLDEQTGLDVAICHVATEFIKLQDEKKRNQQIMKILDRKCRNYKKELIILRDYIDPIDLRILLEDVEL